MSTPDQDDSAQPGIRPERLFACAAACFGKTTGEAARYHRHLVEAGVIPAGTGGPGRPKLIHGPDPIADYLLALAAAPSARSSAAVVRRYRALRGAVVERRNELEEAGAKFETRRRTLELSRAAAAALGRPTDADDNALRHLRDIMDSLDHSRRAGEVERLHPVLQALCWPDRPLGMILSLLVAWGNTADGRRRLADAQLWLGVRRDRPDATIRINDRRSFESFAINFTEAEAAAEEDRPPAARLTCVLDGDVIAAFGALLDPTTTGNENAPPDEADGASLEAGRRDCRPDVTPTEGAHGARDGRRVQAGVRGLPRSARPLSSPAARGDPREQHHRVRPPG